MDNYLDKIQLTVDDIENEIKNYNLEFPKLKDNKIENKIKLPMFVYDFYNFILEKNKIPTQLELYNYYIDKHKNNKFIKEFDDHDFKALKARIYRGHPSWVRDIHFGKYLQENTEFNVLYNVYLDTEQGIDLLVDDKYAINLYINTYRARMKRAAKKYRHNKHDYVNIELPINFWDSKKIGDFFLYSDVELEKLENKICV